MTAANPSRRLRALVAPAALLLAAGAALAQSPPPAPPPDPAALKQQLDELIRQNQELQQKMADLQRRLEEIEKQKATPSATPPPAGGPSAPAAPSGPAASAPAAPSAGAKTPQEALDAAVAAAQPAAAPAAGQPATTGAKTPQEALESAVTEVQQPSPGQLQAPVGKPGDLLAFKAGSATVRLIDLSLVIDTAAGWSSATDAQLLTLQGGDHDPKRRGFTLQAAEIGLAGAVDPYFTAQANINFNIDSATGESNTEIEEAFATSQSLPWNLQVKAGLYFTEFGLLNPTHPHTWDWMDQPVVLTRLFGGDGMRGPGARVSWLAPLPWFSQFIVGAQNGNGETMVSFLANEESFDAHQFDGGRPFVDTGVSGLGDLVWSGRWENFFELSKETTLKVGASAVIGPNATGSDGQTLIYGADMKLKWRALTNERGWPFVIWQSEILKRNYEAAESVSGGTVFPEETLYDWGLYTQVLYGFTPNWAAGLRYEYASGSGGVDRENNPFRDNRQRLSPLLVWDLSEFSRLRLQYNHDWADHLPSGHADSIYLGLEVLFGAHPAHTY
jgi:hypothetical protein